MWKQILFILFIIIVVNVKHTAERFGIPRSSENLFVGEGGGAEALFLGLPVICYHRVCCLVKLCRRRCATFATLADNANGNIPREFSASGTVAQWKWAWPAWKPVGLVLHHFPALFKRAPNVGQRLSLQQLKRESLTDGA